MSLARTCTVSELFRFTFLIRNSPAVVGFMTTRCAHSPPLMRISSSLNSPSQLVSSSAVPYPPKTKGHACPCPALLASSCFIARCNPRSCRHQSCGMVHQDCSCALLSSLFPRALRPVAPQVRMDPSSLLHHRCSTIATPSSLCRCRPPPLHGKAVYVRACESATVELTHLCLATSPRLRRGRRKLGL